MHPYPGKSLTLGKKIFNYRLSRAHQTIENTFGIMAARWQFYFTVIHASYKMVTSIIKATVCLHNFLMYQSSRMDIYCPVGFTDEEENGTVIPGSWRAVTDGMELPSLPTRGSHATNEAMALHDVLQDYFLGEHGQVPWQLHMVTRGQWNICHFIVQGYFNKSILFPCLLIFICNNCIFFNIK